MSGWGRIFGRAFTQAAMRQARKSARRASAPPAGARGPVAPREAQSEDRAAGQDRAGIGAYAARPDGRPDPGEVVWAWVPYEEDPAQGKDRPVLLIGREGETLLGLSLTSKDHDRDAAQEERAGRLWLDIGSGGWDREGRPSEVRINRLLRLDPGTVRREGAAVDQATYDRVFAAARPHLGL